MGCKPPYVQHSYNRSLQSSINHNPFQVCPSFQQLAPIDVALSIVSTQEESSHAQIEADITTIVFNRSNKSNNKVMIVYGMLMSSTTSETINIDFHTSLRLVIRYGFTCRKIVPRVPTRTSYHSDLGLKP
jgi:hypothetical protein